MTDRLLIIGCSGQIARELERKASRFGYSPKAFGHDKLNFAENGIEGLLDTERPHLVVNAAAYTAVDRAEGDEEAALRLNSSAPVMAATACADAGIPFVHISTDYVFDGRKEEPYAETDRRNPLGVYGRSKALGEEGIQAIKGDWAIVRTAWVFSPFGSNFVKTMLRLAKSQPEVSVVADQVGCPTSAADVAEACLRLGRAISDRSVSGGQIWHAVGAGETTWAGFAEEIFVQAARRGLRRPALRPIKTSEYPTPAERPANSRLSPEKLAAALGWRPRPWREALSLVLDELIVC